MFVDALHSHGMCFIVVRRDYRLKFYFHYSAVYMAKDLFAEINNSEKDSLRRYRSLLNNS